MRKGAFMKINKIFGVSILLAVFVLVSATYLIVTPREASASAGQLIRFTIELADREAGFHQTISADTIVFDGMSDAIIGTVVYAYGLPFLQDAPDEVANIIRRAEVAGREFTYIVVETIVSVSDYSIEVNGFPIRVNKAIYTRSRDFGGGGFIVRMEML